MNFEWRRYSFEVPLYLSSSVHARFQVPQQDSHPVHERSRCFLRLQPEWKISKCELPIHIPIALLNSTTTISYSVVEQQFK